jgi:hypothetical protein
MDDLPYSWLPPDDSEFRTMLREMHEMEQAQMEPYRAGMAAADADLIEALAEDDNLPADVCEVLGLPPVILQPGWLT